MSTTRRRLGTGPTTTRSTSIPGEAPRLLPVERIAGRELRETGDPGAAVTEQPRRRILRPPLPEA
ncbi:hypothetical protein [Streptomyces fagopyri]|uniref:hypothetical protein n=1 Tax=Streptomyces fagopyri TaxID=2662397 RepID=UPI00371A3C2B